MKTPIALGLSLAAACGTDGTAPVDPPIDPPIDPPSELTPLERCLADGGTLAEKWATSNQHGAVTSITAGDTTIVLGSIDGSVKQWSIDGSSPSYGTPFLDDTGIVVDGLAFGSDGIVAGVDRDGRLSEWRVADARPMRTTPVLADGALTAVAIASGLAAVARGLEAPDLYVVDRASGAVTGPLTTTLWGASSLAFSGASLYTAGHWYGVPMIERRAAADPDAVTDEWLDQSLAGNVKAIAVDAARLVAAGDDFVAIFDPAALETGAKTINAAPGHEGIGVTLLTDAFVSVGREGTLRVWSLAGEERASLAIPEPVGIGRDAAGTTLFTAGPDGMLRAFACR